METVVVNASGVSDFVDDGDEHFVLEVFHVPAHVAEREPEDRHDVRTLLAGAFGVGHTLVQAKQRGLIRMSVENLHDDVVQHMVEFIRQIVERVGNHPIELVLRHRLHHENLT